MKMASEDIKKYPECAKLLHHLRSQLSQKVLEAFFDACQADYLNGANPAHVDHVARTALLWGGPPLVDVHQNELRVPERGVVVPACGFTDTFPGHAPYIIVTHIWFDAYEYCGEADRPKNATRLIRTMLHEMVHWVRDAVGADDDITAGGYKGTAEEAGHYFEMKAYGTRNVCTDENMKDARDAMRPPV